VWVPGRRGNNAGLAIGQVDVPVTQSAVQRSYGRRPPDLAMCKNRDRGYGKRKRRRRQV